MTPTVRKLRWNFWVCKFVWIILKRKEQISKSVSTVLIVSSKVQCSVLKKLCRRELSNFGDSGLKLQLLSLSVVMLHSTATYPWFSGNVLLFQMSTQHPGMSLHDKLYQSLACITASNKHCSEKV